MDNPQRFNVSDIGAQIPEAVVQAIPFVGGPLSALTFGAYNRLQQRRREEFMRVLEQRLSVVEESVLETEEFAAAATAALHAAAADADIRKVRLFATGLANFAQLKHLDNLDIFQEQVNVLASMSLREFLAICTLDEIERGTAMSADLDEATARNKRAIELWPQFEERLVKELGVPWAQIPGFVTRLSRTGLFREGSGLDMKYEGYITPNFSALMENLGLYDEVGKVRAVDDGNSPP